MVHRLESSGGSAPPDVKRKHKPEANNQPSKPQRAETPKVFTKEKEPKLDRLPPSEALHPNVSPQRAAAGINGYHDAERDGHSGKREHVVAALRQHHDDPDWQAAFFRSLGSDRSAKLLNQFGEPARYGNRGAVERDLGVVRHSFAEMNRAGNLTQADVNHLVQRLNENDMSPYVATDVLGKTPDAGFKAKFIDAAVAQGGDRMNAAAVHVLGRLPHDQQRDIQRQWTSAGKIDEIFAGARRGAQQLLTLADQVAQIRGATNRSAPPTQLFGDVDKLFPPDPGANGAVPKKLPFNPHEGISPHRSDELDGRATKLRLEQGRDGSVSFRDVGKMMQNIAGMTDLSEREKASLWSRVANGTKEHGLTLEGLRPENRDSYLPWTSDKHIILGFDDGFHGPLAMLPLPEAQQKIFEHEKDEFGLPGRAIRGLWPGGPAINIGDMNASNRQVMALKAYMSGDFQAYANEWNRLFIE